MADQRKLLSRREFLRISAVTAAGAALAACAPATPVEEPEVEEPEVEEEAEAEEPQVPAADAVEVSYLMVSWNDPLRELLEGEILPAFQDANPGLTVKVDYTTWGELDPKVMTAFAGGLAPDIFQADTVEFGVKYYGRGIITELESLIEAAGGASILDDYYQKGVYEGSAVKGKVIGLPYQLDNRAELYRMDFFEEVGLDPESPPKDWDEFREAAIALTVRDGDTITRAGYHVWAQAWSIQWFFPYMWQAGGTMLNESEDRAAFDSDESVEALEFITNLLREDKVGPLEEMPDIGDLNPIGAGTRAMQHGNASTLRNIAEFAPDVLDHMGMFIPENQTKGHLWYANTMHLTKGDRVDEAWMLLEHLLLDYDNGLAIHTALQDLPARVSIADAAPHMTPLVKKLIDEVMTAPGSRTTPIVEFAGEVMPRVDEAIAKSLYGEASPSEALSAAAEEANEIIDRYLEGE